MSPPANPPSRHIERVARLAAQGVDVRDLTSAVQAELTSLLLARSCRFDTDDDTQTQVRLERDGSVTGHGFDLVLPDTLLEIPVRLGPHEFGRFTVDPTPDAIVPLEARIVALMLSDHLAAAIARRHPTVPPLK